MKPTPEMIEAHAIADAKFAGMDFAALGRADKKRYLERSACCLSAALSVQPAAAAGVPIDRYEAMLDSQYRAGAKAGWNAAHLPEGEANAKLAELTRVEKGALAALRTVQPEAAVVGEPVDRDMIIVGDTAYPVDSEVCRAFNAFLIESFGERELLDALISADGLLRQLGHSLPNVKAAIAKADHRSTISAAPSAPDELRRIGAQMSNILFNLSQGGDIPERFRKQFRDLTREWDAALGGASHE